MPTDTTPAAHTRCVADLQPGDMVDLYGDRFADPERDPLKGFEFEYAVVDSIERETPECVCVYFEGNNPVGFPADHSVEVAS